MADFKSYRKESEVQYGHTVDNATLEQINVGSLQRIADACELMASNYLKLQREKEMYANWYKEYTQKWQRSERRIVSMKGVITKLKNRLVTQRNPNIYSSAD